MLLIGLEFSDSVQWISVSLLTCCLIGYRFQHNLKKLPCSLAVRFVYQSRDGELAGSVNGYKVSDKAAPWVNRFPVPG